MNSSPSPCLDREHRDPTFHLAIAHLCQSKRAEASKTFLGRAGSRHRSARISLLLSLTFLLVVGGRLSVSFAQNAPASDTKGSLVLFDFGDANDKQIRDAAITRFNKRYPNVKVTDQFTPISSWSDYLNKLVTQIASGKAPDLIHIATEGVQLAVRKNLVIPLDELTSEPPGKELLSDVDPALVKGFSVEGKLYLVPVAWNNMMVYY
jgi:ABC-type glycerol-3-phosphate transport system substrate-binding protein